MLDLDPWRRAAAQMNERWWIQIDPERARTRLVKRHVQTGVAKDLDEAVWRAENNDEDSECVDCHVAQGCSFRIRRWKAYLEQFVQRDVYHREYR